MIAKEIKGNETKDIIRQAIKEYDLKKIKEQKRKVFHNTKLLLKHYNDLQLHVNKAIDNIESLGTDARLKNDELDRDELYILSIRRSKSKTLIMIAHIDMSLKQLKQKQKKLSSIEKYLALERYYIKEHSYEQVSEDLNCSVITARRWVNEMTTELGVLLFGIDACKFEMI